MGGTVRSGPQQRNRPFKGSKKSKPKSDLKKVTITSSKIASGKEARKQQRCAIRTRKQASIKSAQSRNNHSNSPYNLVFVAANESVNFLEIQHTIVTVIAYELVRLGSLNRSELERFTQETELALKTENRAVFPLPAWAGKNKFVQLIFTPILNGGDFVSQMPIIIDCLDYAKVADYVVVCYGDADAEDAGFNAGSNELISLLLNQGLPEVVAIRTLTSRLADLHGTFSGNKVIPAHLATVVRSAQTTFGKNVKVFDFLDTMHGIINGELSYETIKNKNTLPINTFFRHFCDRAVPTVRWRESQRGYMLVNTVEALPDGTIAVTGYSKGLGFTSKYATHITGAGDFSVMEIGCATTETNGAFATVEVMTTHEASSLIWEPFGIPDDDDRMSGSSDIDSDEDEAGTDCVADSSESEIECAMHSDDSFSDSGENNAAEPDLGYVDYDRTGDWQQRNWVDMEFPDEVDVPNDVPARERFHKYIALKNFRSSPWNNPHDNVCVGTQKLIKFNTYKHTRKLAKIKYLKTLEESTSQASAATRTSGLRLYKLILKAGAPNEVVTAENPTYQTLHARLLARKPIVLSTLTPIERKVSAQHYVVRSFGDCTTTMTPRKSDMIIQCGFRRVFSNPLWSHMKLAAQQIPVEITNHHLYKMKECRYLNTTPSGTALCSSIGATHHFNSPCIFWYMGCNQKYSEEMDSCCERDIKDELESIRVKPQRGLAVAGGHFLTTDPDRLILKRILLTGYPHKINSKRCTVRKMFNNRNDVEAFANVPLFTKRKRNGKIMDAIGLHGDMKCEFDNSVTHGDTVCLPLFKRAVLPYDTTEQKYLTTPN